MDPLMNMPSFLDVAILLTLMILSLSFLFTAYRIIKGPTLGDRIIGLDMLVAVGIGFIAVIGVKTDFYLYTDIAIALGLVGFLSTLAFARFVLHHGDSSEYFDEKEAAKAEADAKRALEGLE
ncbi:multicomponent Na+:H+ antiporter subunit F [Cohaesibacter marisflavi]|uniref:Multicomponent Na+:H+ antiporter subunit F n=1 Tax=Cohaesibacter marisflavi TaxID=655353 RepID=A0A1I5A1X5_9HYPH|nr:cation:proton antiporter [Cohaesibacter marisflavi]SFN56340.1 multicomponent Na+:H+ antiporter subunit F [Cohaesibacter marisflavi]